MMQLLGDVLLTKDGETPTAEALAGKTHVGLYFSAHWCPPCRGFTPKLGESYTKYLKDKGLEIIFVSSDKDEEAFKEYFGEMPWTALPFADRERKEALSKKFKVQGIPTFVILDADGSIVTKDGRKALAGDEEGKEFPWKPKTIAELLAVDVLTKDGSTKPMSSLVDNKVLGLYFSAHWCPPCRGFTPKLAEQYKKIQEAGLPFEIVFVSSDRDEGSFQEYYGEMPWLALPYEKRQVKEQLSDTFGVEGIPSFVLLDKDRSTITTNGRGAIMGSLEDFPWYPKPIANVAEGVDGLNETASIVLLCDGSDKGAQDAAYAALEPIALESRAAAKASGEDPEFCFFIATSSEGPVGQIRRLCGLPSVGPTPHEHPLESKEDASGNWGCDGCGRSGRECTKRYRCTQGCDFDFCDECNTAANKPRDPVAPTVVLMDIPDQGGFYLPALSDITESSLRGMLEAYKNKSLERKQLG
jgi:nucleoredoxin